MLFTFEHVTFGYLGVPTVEDVCFSVHERERVGLLGGNGEGKTTLLRLLTGELAPDAGAVVRKNGLTIGYLEQSGGFTSDATVYGAMEEVFEEDKQLIDVEPTKVRTKSGEVRNGTLQFTIRPIQEAVNCHLERQFAGLPQKKRTRKRK